MFKNKTDTYMENRVNKLEAELKEIKEEYYDFRVKKLKKLLNEYVRTVYITDERTNNEWKLTNGNLCIYEGKAWSEETKTKDRLIASFTEGYSIEFVIE